MGEAVEKRLQALAQKLSDTHEVVLATERPRARSAARRMTGISKK
jgi:hypothetical protein